MSVVLWGVVVFLGIIAVYLAFVAFGPGFRIAVPPVEGSAREAQRLGAAPPTTRQDVTFDVDETSISAWLYLPEDQSAPIPCIVMAHGLGGTKDFVLEAYAIRYTEAGFAVLTFDYRSFGESEGEPRQLVWVPHQLADLAAAVAYARMRPEIDPDRIAIWGTSAGGGYGITLAARDHRIAAVVSQVPGLDPQGSIKALSQREGIRYVLRLVVHAQRDMVRKRLRLAPHRIPLVGRPGTLAMMNTQEAYDFMAKMVPQGYVNEVCARFVLRPYRPLENTREVRCPVLLQLADRDDLAPPSGGERMAEMLGSLAEVQRYPIGHFDIYLGTHFERAVDHQIAFFRKHLLAGPP